MNKRQLGKTDLYLSEISLGCMSLGTDQAQAKSIIDRAIDSGVNYLDTADLYDYGKNEELIGEAIRGRRQDLIIGSKVGNRFTPGEEGWTWDPSKEHIKSSVKDSLKRLGTDYIDLYQLHGGTIDDPIDETIEAFEDLKSEGWIREYGISSIRPNVIKQFAEKSSIASVMMQYSALDRRPEEEILPLLHEYEISVLARGPLAKGILSDRGIEKARDKAGDGILEYDADEVMSIARDWKKVSNTSKSAEAVALQYVLHHPAVTTAVFGASSVEQLEQNLTFLEAAPLSDAEYNNIQSLTKDITYQQHR
ncbi:UNVERIFIED_CONTAM: aldo/keto reductase [Halobacillus marinus]|uniref:aldo/keto reductase n=1 Tax=Bacillaceae TaxID=186817 RepID=UPI0002A4FEBF|nr:MULTISPECIES: aldo/keto reductase [Bacillaceae]ELK44451.1 aldo/keto reductase family protein [Halobacillus sp. BAB-2008]QHT46941.1 aldo/keto reductase [Bacillus sp. SB49]